VALVSAPQIAVDTPTTQVPDNEANSLRQLARILASARSYNGRHFPSLADQFHASVEALAIRLEELALIDL